MTILLINNNPVVSRLLSLCTRDAAMVLETVSSIDEASAVRYDVLFVDEGSCEGDVASLSTRLDVGKKVYLSYNDDSMAGFDETIKKPFLPSQVMDVLENVEVREEIDEVLNEEISIDEEVEEISHNEEAPSIFPLSAEEIDEDVEVIEEEEPALEVLDRAEIEKIKALLDMDEEEIEVFNLNEETYESRKIEVIKEQLIADGLEILEEEEIVDELSKPKKEEEKSKTKKTKPEKIKKEKKNKEKKNKKKKKKNEKFTEDEWFAIEDAINHLKPKKIKKLLKGKEIELKIEIKGKK